MNLKIAFKLVILLTALTATICAILLLKQGHMDAFWTSLGVKSGPRFNWCEERVSSLFIYDDQSKLLEKDGKWMWVKNGKERSLDYLRVEKWFAKYCQVQATQIENIRNTITKPVFEASFIDGSRLTLSTDPDSPLMFRIRGQSFESETLRKALKELLAFGEKIE